MCGGRGRVDLCAGERAHSAEGGFHGAGEAGLVHEGGFLQARAELPAELGEAREIGREGGDGLDVGFVGGAGPFGETKGGELAESAAADGGFAEAAGDRDAHPAGIEAGGVAVAGEGIEGEIDLVIGFQIAWAELKAEEGKAGGVDVESGEAGLKAGTSGTFGGHEQELGLRDTLEDGRPECEGMIGDFAGGVEGAEGDVAAREGGEAAHGDVGEGVVAPEGIREAVDAFAVEVFEVRWDEVGIGEEEVHGGQAGGAGIAEPGDLHGRGAAGKDTRAPAGHVEGEIDEQIEAIGADLLAGEIIGKGADVAPMGGEGLDAGGEIVGARDIGIAENLEGAAVEGRKKGKGEKGLAMVAEIAGEKAHAQGAIVRGAIGLEGGGREGGERGGVAGVPSEAFIKDGLAGLGLEMEAIGEVAVGEGIGGIKVDGLSEEVDGGIDVAGFAGGIAEVVGDGGGMRVEGLGAGEQLEGGVEVACGAQDARGAGEGGDGLGIDGECGQGGLPGIGEQPNGHACMSKADVGVEVAGIEGDGVAEMKGRCAVFAEVQESEAEVVVGIGVVRVEAEGFAERGSGLGKFAALAEEGAEVDMVGGARGFEGNGLAELGEGFDIPAAAGEELAEVGMGAGEIGAEADGLAIGGLGGGELVELEEAVAEVGVGFGETWLEGEGGLIGFGGELPMGEGFVGAAQGEVDFGESRGGLKHRAVGGDGFIKPAEIGERLAEGEAEADFLGAQGDGFLEGVEGEAGAALLEIDDADAADGLREERRRGAEGQDLLVEGAGLGEVAAGVGLCGVIEDFRDGGHGVPRLQSYPVADLAGCRDGYTTARAVRAEARGGHARAACFIMAGHGFSGARPWTTRFSPERPFPFLWMQR